MLVDGHLWNRTINHSAHMINHIVHVTSIFVHITYLRAHMIILSMILFHQFPLNLHHQLTGNASWSNMITLIVCL